jgi:hypothetical protein
MFINSRNNIQRGVKIDSSKGTSSSIKTSIKVHDKFPISSSLATSTPALRRNHEFKGLFINIIKNLFIDIPETLRDLHIDRILHMITHKGDEYTVRYLKATHESVDNVVLRLGKTMQHRKVSIGLDSNG